MFFSAYIYLFYFKAKELYHTRVSELERLKRDGASQKDTEKVSVVRINLLLVVIRRITFMS